MDDGGAHHYLWLDLCWPLSNRMFTLRWSPYRCDRSMRVYRASHSAEWPVKLSHGKFVYLNAHVASLTMPFLSFSGLVSPLMAAHSRCQQLETPKAWASTPSHLTCILVLPAAPYESLVCKHAGVFVNALAAPRMMSAQPGLWFLNQCVIRPAMRSKVPSVCI